jgi:hypothetical protein
MLWRRCAETADVTDGGSRANPILRFLSCERPFKSATYPSPGSLTSGRGIINDEQTFIIDIRRQGVVMRYKFKFPVWGPGGLGGVALLEVARLDSPELVGVRAFSPDKVGKDAGDLIGIAPVGVAASDDVAALLALDADCQIYPPRDFGMNNTDALLPSFGPGLIWRRDLHSTPVGTH